MKPKTKSEMMAEWASQPDQLKREREVKAIRKAMDDARAVMRDGLTRYVKKKTKARSMAKAEADPFAELEGWESMEQIQDAYGYGEITADRRDKLTDLWEAREAARNSRKGADKYHDLVTEMLETPFKVYIYCTKAPQQLITIFKDGEETMDGEIHHGKPVFIKFNKLLPDSVRGKTQAVIGEFICDDIRRIGPEYCIVKEDIESAISGSCLTVPQVKDYAGWKSGMSYADLKDLYGWHISNFKLYKKPVKLKDFWAIQPCTHRGDCCTCRRWDAEKLICRGEAFGIERPPQSWCYMEDGR